MDIYERLQLDPGSDVPLVVQLTEQLTWLVASGALQTGERLPTIRSLADTVGVHMHTVRSAYQRLEADGLVSVRTRRGTVVEEIDPDWITRARPGQRSFLIGVLLPGYSETYRPYLEAIHEAAAANHWLPLVVYTNNNPLLSERLLQQLIAKQVDGFIVTSAGVGQDFLRLARTEAFPPIAFVDTPHIPRNCILPDSERAAYLATGHLIQHGYESVGVITPPLDWETSAPCLSGYRRALSEAGVPQDLSWIVEVPDYRLESGAGGARQILEMNPRPRAVFALADNLAFGALQAFHQAGVRVPQDLALASYNDLPAAALVRPALTTATIPAYQMGLEAVALLERLITSRREQETPIVLPTDLIIRQSCGCE